VSNGAAALLREWHDSGCPVVVFETETSSNTGQKKTGKVSRLDLTKFEVSWDEGGSKEFSYDVITTIDGRQIRLIDPKGVIVVVHEVKS
jgi:hypothetical protein